MIRLVVIGTSASMPSKQHVPSAFAIKYGGTYLFDCPEGCQRQMMKHGVSFNVDAVFLSHLHADHFLGLPGIIQSMNLSARTKELLITGPSGTKELFETLLALRPLRAAFPIKIKEFSKTGTALKTDLFTVKAFPVEHGCKALGYSFECASYRRFDETKAKSKGVQGRLFTELQEKGSVKIDDKTIKLEDVTYIQQGKKIVYSGDTQPCAALTRAAKTADLLVMDSCFSDKHSALAKEKKHSTTKQAAQTALKAKAKQLLLTHFSNRYDNRAELLGEAKQIFENSILAEEGLELMI